MPVNPDLPCGYCCGAGPLCGDESPEHDDMGCLACQAIPLSDPHSDCLEMLAAYMDECRKDPT